MFPVSFDLHQSQTQSLIFVSLLIILALVFCCWDGQKVDQDLSVDLGLGYDRSLNTLQSEMVIYLFLKNIINYSESTLLKALWHN